MTLWQFYKSIEKVSPGLLPVIAVVLCLSYADEILSAYSLNVPRLDKNF